MCFRNKKRNDTEKIFYLFLVLLCFTFIVYLICRLLQTPKINTVGTVDGWLGYYGGIFGGAMTMIGVYATLNYERKSKRNDLIIEQCPLLTIKNPLFHPELQLEDLEGTDGTQDNWYVRYNINFDLLLANSNPAISIIPICHLRSFFSDETCPRLWIVETKNPFQLTTQGQTYTFFSHIDYDPGMSFIKGRDEAGSKFINKIYFEYSNSFGDKYLLEITHTLIAHGRKSNCKNQYNVKKDFDYYLCAKDGREIFYSDNIDTKLYYDQHEIDNMKKMINNLSR